MTRIVKFVAQTNAELLLLQKEDGQNHLEIESARAGNKWKAPKTDVGLIRISDGLDVPTGGEIA